MNTYVFKTLSLEKFSFLLVVKHRDICACIDMVLDHVVKNAVINCVGARQDDILLLGAGNISHYSFDRIDESTVRPHVVCA